MAGGRLALALGVVCAVMAATADASTPVYTSTWKLVPAAECAPPKKRIGTACVDYAGHPEWQVTATTTTYHFERWDYTYTYRLPSSVPPAPASAIADLSVTVNCRDPARCGGQICISSGFASGDTCARALAENGQTASGNKSVKLSGFRAEDGGTATLRIGVQDGPDLYFTYEATAPPVAKLTVLFAAHQLTDQYGELTLAASGTFSTTSTTKGCKTSCHLALKPTGSFYGLQRFEEWHGYDDLRIKFKIVSGRLDKGPGTRLAADIVGRVVSVTAAGTNGTPDTCKVGSEVGLYGTTGAKKSVHFGCGGIVQVYRRFVVFRATGSALG
jgi:hypothetical protein